MNVCVIILNNKHKHGHINIRFEYGYLVYTSLPVTWQHAVRIFDRNLAGLLEATVVSNRQCLQSSQEYEPEQISSLTVKLTAPPLFKLSSVPCVHYATYAAL